MTPAEFKAAMEEIASQDSPEGGHIEADELMCRLLTSLGYGEGVSLFEDMRKWYS